MTALSKVLSGWQSGADRGGVRAARRFGLATGGMMPLGFKAEDGPHPEFALFGVVEHTSRAYPPRTEANVRNADATLIFPALTCGPLSGGTQLTIECCQRLGKPYLVVEPGRTTPRQVAEWIDCHAVRVLNVAGGRESRNPGLGARVEAFLCQVFRAMELVELEG